MKTKGNVAIFVPHLGCPRDCSFCNQRTISGSEVPPTPLVVEKTLEEALENLGENAQFMEIAFFGGSFTAIESELMHSLLLAANKYCGAGKFSGIRFSTRPDCISEAILDSLQQYNVKHIELGAQSMDNAVLTANNRGHMSEDVEYATQMLTEYGYKFTLQMMTGLYMDTPQGAIETANKIIAMQPDSVRIYPTITLKGTELESLLKSGKYTPPSLEETVDLCSKLLIMFEVANIPVIRLGLHDGDSVRVNYIAGAHHPALRELCIGKALVAQIKKEFDRLGKEPQEFEIQVSPQNLSALIGHGRVALRDLEKSKEKLSITTNNKLTGLDILITNRGTERR